MKFFGANGRNGVAFTLKIMWNYVWLVVVVLAVAFSFWNHRRRASEIRELAARLGFTYIGSALPRTLSLAGTTLATVSSVWNVIDGEPHGTRIIAFDCKVGSGKGSWRRTVIAVWSESESFRAILLTPEVISERSEKWTIYYQPKSYSFIPPGLMPVSELEAKLNGIRK